MLCFCLYCSNVPPHISHTMCCQCANVSYSTPLPHHSLESGYLPPPPPPPVSLDWSHGWLAWMAVSPEWKYCRARGRHHLRTMRTDIWFTKMAMCCKIDVRELFIFYKKLFFIFFIIVFFTWVNRFLILLTVVVWKSILFILVNTALHTTCCHIIYDGSQVYFVQVTKIKWEMIYKAEGNIQSLK